MVRGVHWVWKMQGGVVGGALCGDEAVTAHRKKRAISAKDAATTKGEQSGEAQRAVACLWMSLPETRGAHAHRGEPTYQLTAHCPRWCAVPAFTGEALLPTRPTAHAPVTAHGGASPVNAGAAVPAFTGEPLLPTRIHTSSAEFRRC